jgi:hypothetical protein
MKRIRRVSVEIERRETRVSVTINDAHDDPARRNPPGHSTLGGSCAICGAPLALVVQQVAASADSYIHQILAALMESGLHSFNYFGGDLWVCSQSFSHSNHP